MKGHLPHSANCSACCQNAYQEISHHKIFSYNIHIANRLILQGFCALPDLCTGHCQGVACMFLESDTALSLQRASSTAPNKRENDIDMRETAIKMQ